MIPDSVLNPRVSGFKNLNSFYEDSAHRCWKGSLPVPTLKLLIVTHVKPLVYGLYSLNAYEVSLVVYWNL